MQAKILRVVSVIVLGISVCVTIAGCGGSTASTRNNQLPLTDPVVSITISPKNVSNLPAEATQNFTATVSGSSNQAVTWSVREGAACGSVSSGGTYLAPNSPGLVCHVVATSQADSTKSDTATVTISQISMYVLPFQVSLGAGQTQIFAATVQGTSNVAVTWSVKEGASGGIITGQGVYTAPQTLGTFHVIATSQADSRFTASAEVDVVPIAVSISPVEDTLGPLGMRTFAASVVGTNQAVTWSVQEGISAGSITQQGVYTAPQNQGSFHIVATSMEDTNKEAIATISVVQSGFLSTGSMSTDRAFHTATLLGINKVLIVGGCEEDYQTGCAPKSSAEVFDPSAGTFSPTGGLAVARASHTATLIPDGKLLANSKVLVAGGSRDDSAELYDSASGTFTPTGSMTAVRHSHTASLLPGGKVLLAGGADLSGAPLASAELYDASTGTFTVTGSMQKPRVGHSATLLASGKVLIAGGYSPACAGCIVVPDSTAELYDPATGLFTRTGDMPGPIAIHTATRLANGVVLVTGGDFCGATGAGGGSECAAEDGTNQALLYDPATGTFSVTGSMAYARIGHSATLLSDGKVLIAGGLGADPVTFDDVTTFTAELYDPATGLFSRTGSMDSARTSHTATLLSNGTVLVSGGCGQFECSVSSAELYK
jgi:Galactose oxidase, central domain